jgi:hypothetical protein
LDSRKRSCQIWGRGIYPHLQVHRGSTKLAHPLFLYGNTSLAGGKYIVDSGTSLKMMPTKKADAINKQFSPPAIYNINSGNYNVNCTAKALHLGVIIRGTVFYINPIDMIFVSGKDKNGNRICISGVSDGGHNFTEDIYILGDVFIKNIGV